MRDIPDYYWKWTEDEYETGMRVVKPDVPHNILTKLIDDERYLFEITGRIGLINVDLETGQLIPVEEGAKHYYEYEKAKIERLRAAKNKNDE